MSVSLRRGASLALFGLLALVPLGALAAPVPGFTPAPNGAGPVLTNEPYTAQACFDNLSPTDTGYQPKYQMVVPGGSTLASAQYLSFNLALQTVGTCNAAGGCPTGFVNPATGTTVPLQFGETLVIVGGSSGSFAPAQPPACVDLVFNLGDATVAPLNVTRNITITPFFAFGADPLDNPQSDPPIVGAPATLGVTPSVIRLAKAIAAPESETATGPNYPRTFTLTLNVADGQTVTDVDLADVLPGTLQYVAGSAVVTGCGGAVSSVSTPSGSVPGGTLTRRCPTVTGTTAGNDLVLTFQAFVPRNDVGGTPVVTPTAPVRTIPNQASVAGTYDPPGAGAAGPIAANSNTATLAAKLLTLRKGVAVVNDTAPAGPSPGDTLEYTLTFDLSDYHSVALAGANRLQFTDVLGDGQTFAGCGSATIAAQANGVSLPATPLAGACSAASKAANGTTTITLDAAALLQPASGDTLHGDLANDAVRSGATTVTLTLRSIIDVAYAQTPWPGPGQPELTLGDTVGNAATGGGASAGNPVTDGTGASSTIVNATFAKSIYAYKSAAGTPSIPPPPGYLVAPGDSLTYRLTWTLPLASYEIAKIDDYLPSPVFDAAQITAADAASARDPVAVPPAGRWTAGPLDTFTKVNAGEPIGVVQPVLATSGLGGENRVSWDYGTYVGQQAGLVVDLLFTVTATTRPFGDALNLLNLAQLAYQNTVAVVTAEAAGAVTTTRAPNLTLQKTITGSSNPSCVAATPPANYDSARSGCDAGDTIDYRLVIANAGRSPAYNVRIGDDGGLPAAGFAGSCALVLPVTLGDGSTSVATSGNLFSTAATGGLVIDQIPADSDPAVVPGEQVFVNVRCTIATSGLPAPPAGWIDNTARLRYYSSDPAQTTDPLYNFASNQSFPGPNAHKARVALVAPLAIAKSITGSSVAGTTGSNVNAGETLDFSVVVTLAEGEHNGFVLSDSLAVLPDDWSCATPAVNCVDVSVSGTTAVKTATVAATGGTSVGTITWTYTSAQLYASGGNTAAATESSLAAPVTASRSWTRVNPAPAVTKAFDPATADAGDVVQVRLGWSNTATNPASPMFRCVISDTVNTSFFDPATLAELATPAGYAFAANTTTGQVTYTATDTAAACPTVVAGGAVFSVKVRNSVTTGGTVANTATLAADTLPTPQTGGLAVGASATANLTLTAPAANAKVISATTEPDTAGASVAVGEVVTYRVAFTLPDGVTQDVRIVDEMQGSLANLAYVPGSARLARNTTALVAANDRGGINTAAVNSFVAVPVQCVGTAPCATNEVRVDLGDVTNDPAVAGSPDTYTLELQFRVRNVAGNQGGDTRSNRGRLIYRPTGAGADQTLNGGSVTATVVAPIVQVQKAALPVSIAGGGAVTYTLTIRNHASGPGAGPAHDFAFADTLPAELGTPALVLPLPDGVTAAFAGNVLAGTVARLDPSTQIQVQYTATVDPATPLGRTIVNAANAQATSLPGPCGTGGNASAPCTSPLGDPGSADGERTGSGGVNNLAAATTAPFTTAGVNLTKTLVNPQAYYAIGDHASYEIRVALPVGTAKAFRIRDTLPAGLVFDAGSATVATAGGPVSYTGTPTPPGQVAQVLTFDFGDVATATTAGEIVVRYAATVANVIANQSNVPLINSAAALYQDPNNATATITAVAPTHPTVRVGEPNLAVVKSITAGAAGADAGNGVDWSFTVSNGGTTTAYRADVRDVLPSGLANITNVGLATTGSVTLNGTATPLALANVRVKTTVTPNDTIEVADAGLGDASDTIAIAPGASLTITFRATVLNTVTPGQVLTNTVRVPYASRPDCGQPGVLCRDNSSNPGSVDDDDDTQLNNYEESGSASLTIRSNVAIDKQVTPTAAPIGATVLFTTRVDLIEGTTPSVVVTDVLPAGLTYVSHSIAVGNLGMVFGNPAYANRLGSGQTVAFDLGAIVNPANGSAGDDHFTVQITARVDNVGANQNGVVLKNGEQAAGSLVTVTYGIVPTTLTFDAEPGVPGIQGRPVTVQEPLLATTKSAVPPSQSLGDLVTYSVTVSHTGASTSNAYDVVLADTLPAFIAFVPGSVNPPGAFGGVAGQVLTLDLGTLTLAAGSATITYQGRIATSAVVGVPLVNSVAGSYASQPGAIGAPDSGRNGSGGINDYAVAGSASVVPNADAFIDAKKTVAIAIDADGSGSLTPGDTLEYTVVLTNASGAATGVVFTDPIPGRTSYVPGSATTTRGTIAASPALLTVDVGSMGSGDAVTITFRVTVNAGTPTGTVISNQGSVDSDQTVPEPTDVDGVDANGDQPTDIVVGGSPTPASALYAEKYVALNNDIDSSGSVTQGDRMRYTVVLSNVGSAPLADVALSDAIPAGLAYVPGSAVASAGTVSVAGQALDWTRIGSLAPGAFAQLAFDVGIASVTGSVQAYVNQGTATSIQTGPVRTDGNGDPVDGTQPTRFEAVGTGGTAVPVLDAQKRWSLAVDTPPTGLPSPGDGVEYTIFVSNTGSATATNVRLTDPGQTCTGALTPCTAFVPGSLTTSQGAIVTTVPIEVNLGNLPPGANATVSFRVAVDAATADGVVVANQASVTANGQPPVLTDDNGVPGDGRNPTLTPITRGSTAGPPGEPRGLSKSVAGTSEPDGISAGARTVIGEVVRYRIDVAMPKGTLRQVTLADALPAGLAYLPGSARLAHTFDTGLVASANPGGINAAASGSFVALADGAGIVVGSGPAGSTTLSVFLGDVVNSDPDGGVSETYTLEVRATVANVAGNQAGTALSNAATVRFWNGLGQPQSLPPVTAATTVVEPAITLAKSAFPARLPRTGSVVRFTLSIANAAGADVAPAFDVVVSDLLPQAFGSAGPRTIQSTGAVGVVDTTAGPNVGFSIDRLDPGGSVTVRFDVTVAGPVPANGIPNEAMARWTSLPGAGGSGGDGTATPGAPGSATGERTGEGGVNDYTRTAGATVALQPEAIPALHDAALVALAALLLLSGLGRGSRRR